MALTYLEDIGTGEEPVNASFTLEGGGKQGIYMLANPQPGDLLQALTDILGGLTTSSFCFTLYYN